MDKSGRIEITVDAEVNPTEDPEKVRRAVTQIFGELNFQITDEENGKTLIGKGNSVEALNKFHELLLRERILSAARKTLFKGTNGNRITFYLNKQAAFVGHISFSEPFGESPLGPIHVEIECDNPEEFINRLTPRPMQSRKYERD